MSSAIPVPVRPVPRSLIRYTPPAPPPFRPINLAGEPLEVTDGLVALANELLGHAPFTLRQRVFGLVGLPDHPATVIPSVAEANSRGLAQEHAEAVRLMVGMSTLAG